MSNSIFFSRRRKLFACVAAIFALSSAPACATVLVTNCFDHGAGSLRNAVTSAASGESIDATALTTASPGCESSTITLTTGEIAMNGALNLDGPGKDKLTVTALNAVNSHQYQNRIFDIKGTGSSYISGITVSHGVFAQPVALPAKGGCIYSAGELTLASVGVVDCTARADSDGNALGGGVYAHAAIHLLTSTISGNMADAGTPGGAAFGGGLYATDQIVIDHSSILNNYAGHPGRAVGVGGGFVFHSQWPLDMEYSTLAHNKAGDRCGGGEARGGKLNIQLINNTIAYNVSLGHCGALYAEGTDPNVAHNTIVFNYARRNTSAYGSGLTLGQTTFPSYNAYTHLVANIMRDNRDATGTAADLTIAKNMVALHNGINMIETVVGTDWNNESNPVRWKCPLLAPLRDNGGPTPTMALSKFSPALDLMSALPGIVNDQRGAPYVRASAPPDDTDGYVVDIGAYEYQHDDMIFATTFEEGMNCGK